MNGALFQQMLKVHGKGIGSYSIGAAIYMLLMVWVFPTISENTKAIDDLMKALPPEFSDAFGLESGFSSFEGYIAGEFYGLLMPLILTLFIVTKSTQLMARLVDRGSMAYVLAAPTTRRKVAATQAVILVIGLFLIVLMTTLAGFVGFALFIEDASTVDSGRFIWLNVAIFLLFFAIAGLSFMFSCFMNDEKKALGLSGLVAFGFFSLDIVAKVSDKLEWLRFATLYTWYTPSEIVTGKEGLLLQGSLLAVIGLVAFAVGVTVFRKRDLPL